ncbi:MAG: beta-ketoacyl-ACP synthase, partial [Dolichospermum sp.]
LPPCVGLQQPEFNLNLIRSAQESKIKNVLCFSFGFGGQNAIMALGNFKTR